MFSLLSSYYPMLTMFIGSRRPWWHTSQSPSQRWRTEGQLGPAATKGISANTRPSCSIQAGYQHHGRHFNLRQRKCVCGFIIFHEVYILIPSRSNTISPSRMKSWKSTVIFYLTAHHPLSIPLRQWLSIFVPVPKAIEIMATRDGVLLSPLVISREVKSAFTNLA